MTKTSMTVMLICALLMFSCAQNNELETSNAELSEEVAELKKKLEVINHSIVIPYDSIRSYMEPISYQASPDADMLNVLAWKKNPDNMTVKWFFEKDEEVDFSTEYNGQSRLINNPPSSSMWCYITLPNGVVKVQSLETSDML